MAASKQAVFLVPNNAIHVFEDDPVHDGEDKKDKKSARQKATEFLNSPEGNAYINQEGPCHYLADAGSTNGTSHNGRKLEKDQQVELVDGSVLQFSTFQFIYYTPLAFYNVLFGA